ncbi:MAG: enoyl-CoA hydratase/isomerase family protein [Bacteroidetes bacterium]|nr:enoyl-CoA hydratase/isomerase family protein [Bacteroidota bacterium]
MYQFVEYSTVERVCMIVLNRADKKNAFNFQLVKELKEALQRATHDEAVKSIVIKANGTVFSAGADLDYLLRLQQNTFEENLADSNHLKELFEMIYLLPKLVIAQIEGHAIAGGCGLATVCDFSFAVPEAMFGYTEVKIGFIPAIVSFFLVRKIGEGKARELLLTGKLISAEEAHRANIINFISTKEQISADVFAFAKKMNEETSGDSIAMTKELIASIPYMHTNIALSTAAEANANARAGNDCKRGIAAFLNKEKIIW